MAAIRSKHKARSFAVCPPAAAGRRAGAGGYVASLVLALTNNSLELWELSEGAAGAAGGGTAGEGGAAVGVAEKAQNLDLAGHRSDVRAVALASDDSLLLSASNNCVKVRRGAGAVTGGGGGGGGEVVLVRLGLGLGREATAAAGRACWFLACCTPLATPPHLRQVWNPRTGACLRTMDSGYGLCALFAPGNCHVLVGTKEGTIEIFDLGSSARIAAIE